MATVGERAGLATAAGQVGTEPEGSRERGRKRSGMVVPRVFSTEGVSPFDQVDWELADGGDQGRERRADLRADRLRNPAGLEPAGHERRRQQVFLRRGRTRPSARRASGSSIHRVTRTIADWGLDDGYFATAEDGERFYRELTWLCLHQHGAFNSPVWFNVGLYHQYGVDGPAKCNWRWDAETRTVVQPREPVRVSARLGLLHPERRRQHGRHHGAGHAARPCSSSSARGTGTDLSTLRSQPREARRRRQALGPGLLHAGLRPDRRVVKSGGKTRRAAKMQIAQGLAPRHPRIHRVQVEGREEGPGPDRKRGYEANFNGEAYSSIMFQNANLSVRVTDDFMQAVENDERVDDPLGHHRPADGRPTRPASCMDRIAEGDLALRRPRRAVRHDDQPLAHLPEHAADQRQSTRAASTCSSTTRPATWLAST